jgi:hypothetical protein
MKYKVLSSDFTKLYESNFDVEYHQKYINRIGEEIEHNFKSGEFKNFKLLVFEKDDQGRFKDADWIHVNDLEIINE